MPRLSVGDRMPDFFFDTPFEAGRTLAQTAARVRGKTALVFLRYYGCPLCQYDMHRYAEAHEQLTAGGGQMLVALQSAPEQLAGQLQPGQLPYEIICDPQQALYRQLAIAPAASQKELAGLGTLFKLAKARAAGYRHGAYEGEELQLPAVFVLDRALQLTAVHYGARVDDLPGPKELAGLLR